MAIGPFAFIMLLLTAKGVKNVSSTQMAVFLPKDMHMKKIYITVLAVFGALAVFAQAEIKCRRSRIAGVHHEPDHQFLECHHQTEEVKPIRFSRLQAPKCWISPSTNLSACVLIICVRR
jgi:hypothetical protein